MLKNITRSLHDASKTMLEANKVNKAKKSAFRAGAKAHAADTLPSKASKYSKDRWGSKEKNKAKDDEAAAKKDAAKDKANTMKLNAKEKLRKLGHSTKGAVNAFNKGKDLAKNPGPSRGFTDKNIDDKIRTNSFYKKNDSEKSDRYSMGGSGEGRGRFQIMAQKEAHGKIRRHIEDLHDKISSKLKAMKPDHDDVQYHGSKAVDTAKAHLHMLQKLHASLPEESADEAYGDLINETLELVETVTVLAELYGDKE